MAKKNHNEPWLLITFIALAVVVGLFYSFLFPDESLALISHYWHIIVPVLLIIISSYLIFIFYHRFKDSQIEKQTTNKNRQIKLAEQLIWRSRYSLESQKAQILIDNSPESREKWQQVKHSYIKSKLYPVVSESEVPLTMASALIENTLSSNSLRSGRLPTYGVRDLEH